LSKWNDLKTKPSDWKKYFYERNTFLSSQGLMEWQDKSALPNPSTVPQPRQSFTGTCVNGKIIYIGGQTSVRVRFDDVFVFDPVTRTFSKPAIRGNPPKFARHSAVAIGEKIYIFGGYDGFGSFFGLAVLDTVNWTWEYPRVNGTSPIPRTNHAVTAIGTKMYLFGGNDTTSPEKDKLRCGTYDDFVLFDTETMTWQKPATKGKSPCGRSGHHMVAVDGKIYLFGGGLWNDSTKSWLERYNDMYMYDPETSEWTEIHIQNSPNYAFISLPHWTVGFFIFVYNDPVWCFDTITRTWHSLNTKGKKPQKRFLGPASYVKNVNTVYMFGGVYAEVINDFDMLSWPSSISMILQRESDPEANI
jgi:N-acetylneuraminic acid mutarotase